MKLSAVLSRVYTKGEVFSLMRVLNGLSFLIYYTLVLVPNFDRFFSTSGFVHPEEFTFFPGSWLFRIWPHDTVKFVLFVLTVLLFVCYTVGFYARLAQALLIPLQLAFHNANPLVNHEPQQLNNLLLVVLLFAPIDEHFSLKKIPWSSVFGKASPGQQTWILRLMQIYFGTYYFFAGLKKLPDHNWIEGVAVGKLAAWDFLGRHNLVNEFCQIPFVSAALSWFTLAYEMSFLMVSFTPARIFLIPLGLAFHLGITLTFDIGMFFWSMLMWYPLVLRRED